MAGSRTLKLSILADVDDLRKKLGDGSNDVQTFGDKVSDFGAKAGLAFAAATAAAAAYAGKLAIDGVKAAIEDEAAQSKLAGTLERVVGATGATVAAVEKYITQTAIAKGFTDDELRPSFDRLVRSSGDVTKAQEALNIAMDISAATGKSLETVSMAVGKAMDGNSASLAKIAGGFEKSEIQGKSFSELLPVLTERFGGAAQEQAETFAGKMERLGIVMSEAKETVGAFLLDAITPLVTLFVEKGVPTIQTLAEELGENLGPIFEDISNFVTDTLLPSLQAFYDFLSVSVIPFVRDVATGIFDGIRSVLSKVGNAIKNNKDEFDDFYETIKPIVTWISEKAGPIFKTVLKTALEAVGTAIGAVVNSFGKLAGFVSDVVDGIKNIINLVKNNPVVKGIGSLIDKAFGGGKAQGGFVTPSKAYVVGEKGPEIFVPGSAGNIIPNHRIGGGGMTVNLNVTGAIDPEGTARTIVKALNDSFARGTLGSLGFRS